MSPNPKYRMNKIGQPRLGLTDLLMQTKNLVLPADFVQWGTGDASGGMVQPGQPLTAISGKKREKNQKVIYIWNIMVYSMWEQSRRPRVKCHRDGELPGGRRNCPRWGHRTRCCIMDTLLYVATILGRANGRLYTCCPSPRVIRDLSEAPWCFPRRGFLRFTGRWGSECAFGSSPAF